MNKCTFRYYHLPVHSLDIALVHNVTLEFTMLNFCYTLTIASRIMIAKNVGNPLVIFTC